MSSGPGSTSLVEMDIELTSNEPVRAKPYPMSPRQVEILRKEMKRLLDLEVVEIGQSDFASPRILMENPGKDPSACVDYRRLNEITRNQFCSLPNIEEVVGKDMVLWILLKGTFRYPFTKRALKVRCFGDKFWDVPSEKIDIRATFYFCKLTAHVLGGLQKYAGPYIDDIATFSPTWERDVLDAASLLKRLVRRIYQ